jgi:hypothetical protein
MNELDNEVTKHKGFETFGSLLENRTAKNKKTVSAFQEMIDEIRQNLLTPTGKRYPYPAIANAVKHLSYQDIHWLIKKCKDSDNFGRCFWGLLKVK